MIEEGASVKWRSSEYFHSNLLPDDNLAAYMGELTIAWNAGTLHAEGGPCPIIAVYQPETHLGALLHVNGGDAEIDGNNHEDLVNQLLVVVSDVTEYAVCHIFLDESPAPGLMEEEDEAQQIQARRNYATRMKEYLESQGFSNVTVVFNGMGKSVELDTVNGTLLSKDDDDQLAFQSNYQER